MFADAIEDILRDHCAPAVVRHIEAGNPASALWEAVASAGFLELLKPEAEGGAGLPLRDLFMVLAHCGRYAVPVPLAQSIAARALMAPGVSLPSGLLTIAPALQHGANGSLTCPLVPYGAISRHVLAAEGDELLLLDAGFARRQPTGVPNSQIATLTWSGNSTLERLTGDAPALAPLAAATHAALLAGAMARIFEMTLQYCNERVQFGRSLGKFQTVQHQLSVMAEEVAAASMAAEAAFQTSARTPARLAAAMGKARASEAASRVANTAHALHGAIGITEEYDLQLLTRRLHEWRIAHGSESYWNRYIGELVLAGKTTMCEFIFRTHAVHFPASDKLA